MAASGVAASADALAARSWQAPVTLSVSGESGFFPSVAVTPLGDTVAVWQGLGTVRAASRPAGGCFAAAKTVSDTGLPNTYPQVALDAMGGGLVVWNRFDGSRDELRAVVRTAGGIFGPVETISESPGRAFGAQDLAMDSRGDAVVVWERLDGSHSRIQVAVRPAGGSFGPAQTISAVGEDAYEPQVAVDPSGSAAVVWRGFDGTDDRVQAAVRPAGGGFTAPQTISSAGERASLPQIALDSDGNGVAVWQSFDGSVVEVQAAFMTSGGSFGPPESIPDPLPGSVPNGPSLGVDSQGNAVAAWSRGAGADTRGGFDAHIQFALRPAGGSFGSAQTMPGGDAELGPQVAVSPRGDAVIAWGAGVSGVSGEAAAAVRPAGGSFGAPQLLAGPTERAEHGVVAAAIGSQGDAVVAWTDQETDAVRAAVYGSPPPDCAAQPLRRRPVLSQLVLRPRRFRAARSGASISTRAGTRVSYSLSEAAHVRFRIARCRRATRLNHGHRLCIRYRRLRGGFIHNGNEGANRFTFRGRLRHRRLRPGRYRLSARAVDSTGRRSLIEKARFRIVRR